MSSSSSLLVIGAGAAGLMAARELARGGRRVAVIEARERCGGRIHALPAGVFGYRAEAGPEFVHGAARLTRALCREAGLTVAARFGARWRVERGVFTPGRPAAHEDELERALQALDRDMPVAQFLETHLAGERYAEIRHQVTRMVQGYDAGDPKIASTFALREEWLDPEGEQQGRIVEGYGELIDFLEADARVHGASLHFEAEVVAIEDTGGGLVAQCRDGRSFDGDAAVITVPLPILREMTLPALAAERAKAAGDIGYGNVVKILLRFKTAWWADVTAENGRDLADLAFLFSDARVPTWWTQHPAEHSVLTGWYAGPRADTVKGWSQAALIAMGLESLSAIFGRSEDELRGALVAAHATNWGADPFARGAYSYATVKTAAAQAVLRQPAGRVFFSGEALHAGADRGTVEAALASGRDAARLVLGAASI
jgi:monoamine oxidase